jgi:hypothetical protein
MCKGPKWDFVVAVLEFEVTTLTCVLAGQIGAKRFIPRSVPGEPKTLSSVTLPGKVLRSKAFSGD